MFLYSYVVVKSDEFLEFRQKTGTTLSHIVNQAESELGEGEFIIKSSKRWICEDKECKQYIITYVDTIGITRTFKIVHNNMPDALVIFEQLVWHYVDPRIGVTIKVGA